MDLDLVKSEILREVFAQGMTVRTPASERQTPGQAPATWPARMLSEARQAEKLSSVKTPLPKFFNPLFRPQNLINRSLIASARAGANGLSDLMYTANQLGQELELLRRLVFATGATNGAIEFSTLRRSARSNVSIITLPWVLRHTMRLPAGATVLVAGCAENLLSLELASLGFKVIGMDEHECRDEHPNFKFIEADPATPPLAEGSVDAVIAAGHIGREIPGAVVIPMPTEADVAAIQAWRRVLKPGGALLLTIPFGKAAPTAVRLLYDSALLDALLKGWKVEVREFALGTNQQWQYPAPEAEASRTEVTKAGSPRAVALVLARK